SLCRQGSDAVQANLQCPVVQSGFPQEETVTALLYVKMANVGHFSNFHTEVAETQNHAIVSQRLYRLGENRNGSFKTRARPLASIHDNALERFLTAQKIDIHQRKEELFINENLQRIQEWEKLKINTNQLPKVRTN
uniref:Uncharacterized protein n=1 Tax=Panagrolaimus sp. JU765 TaxID=591449 RepID=A0AC34RH84_9BILA